MTARGDVDKDPRGIFICVAANTTAMHGWCVDFRAWIAHPRHDEVPCMRVTSPSTPGRRVLIVDDHPDSADASCLLLTLLGYEAWPATSGAQALAEVERLHPDVVICDLGLPDINGYEVARKIRSRHGAALYLVALTGWDQLADRERALAAGFDQHLVKPANTAHLQAVMAASTRRGDSAPRGDGKRRALHRP
ncbi:MAG TPA: response regulator [Kofleriaceae bacterium]